MANIKTITVFLVDDNALYLKNLERFFSSKPYYNLVSFSTGELCLEALSLNPDIVILDYHLDGIVKNSINGLETLIRIRSVNPHIPVVMLSGETDLEVVKKCMIHDASEFIIKSDICFARLREIITTIFIDKQSDECLILRLKKEMALTV